MKCNFFINNCSSPFDEQFRDCANNHITKNLYLHISFRRFAMQMTHFTPCICLDYNIFGF